MMRSTHNKERWIKEFRGFIFITTFFSLIFLIYIIISTICYEYLLLTDQILLWLIIIPGVCLMIPMIPLIHVMCKYPDWYFEPWDQEEDNDRWY